jgi:hypothetical protein
VGGEGKQGSPLTFEFLKQVLKLELDADAAAVTICDIRSCLPLQR